MKKRLISIVVVLSIILASGAGFGEDEQEKSEAKVKPPTKAKEFGLGQRPKGSTRMKDERDETRMRMARGMMHEQQLKAVQKQIDQQRKIHEELVGELEAIKKLAAEEGASKTSERLGRLILKRNNKFAESVKKFEEKREKIREQIKKQEQNRETRRKRLEEAQKQRNAESENKEYKKGAGRGDAAGKDDGGGNDKGRGAGRGEGRGKNN